jgi:phospholipid N-methyltransferase
MRRALADYRIFWREFRENFHSTGAVLPSGRALSKALSRYVRDGTPPRRILEVGPGTGAVTQWIVSGLKPHDRFDLVELNDRFVERLRQRFKTEPAFQAVADRSNVLHCPVEELTDERAYDVIVCGLPFNNFSAATVEHILTTLAKLAKPGGTLSFFEYFAVRPLRSLVSRREERQRLQGVGQAIAAARHGRQIRQDLIWPNIPPAWVHHLRFDDL